MSGRKHNQGIMMDASNFDGTTDHNYYYHVYVDQYLDEEENEFLDEGDEFFDVVVFNNPIPEGERIEYLLDGMLMENEFSFEHVQRIDALLNGTEVLYEYEDEEFETYD